MRLQRQDHAAHVIGPGVLGIGQDRAGQREAADRAVEIAQTSWWQRSWLERGGVMPLGQEAVAGKPGSPGKGVGAFALATVHSDKETETILHLGGSTGYAVWWNGELVWQCKALHGYHPDADRVVVKLRKGENQILVFSNWLFYVAI